MRAISFLLVLFFFASCEISFASEISSRQSLAQGILENLYNTTGDFQNPCPKIQVSYEKSNVAAYYSRRNVIEIENEAFAICGTFGKDSLNALAFIIGHELAHAQEKTQNSDGVTSYLAFNYVEHSDKRKEHSADLHGLFNSYLAGYKTVEILPQLIQAIYDRYDLIDKDLSQYPSLSVRKQSAFEVKKKVEELILLYEGSNFIAAIGEYKVAAAAYSYIENAYHGREIYNNIGVNYALHAINFIEEDVDILLYPLELDWNIRINKPKNMGGSKDLNIEEQRYRIRYLAKAERELRKAISIDAAYDIAKVNMICVLGLQEKYQEALSYYDENNSNPQLALAAAVVFAKQNTPNSISKARGIWETYRKSSSPMIAYQANYNLKMLAEEKCDPLKSYSCSLPFNPPAMVDNVDLTRTDYPNKFTLDNSEKMKVQIQKKRNSIVYNFSSTDGIFTFQRVKNTPSAQKSTLNQDILSKSITLSNGFFQVCSESNVLFRADETGLIKEWGYYLRR